MITILICALVGLVLGALLAGDCKKLGMVFGIVAGFIAGIALASCIGTTLPQENVLIQETELGPLKDDSGSSGGFFLGFGYINRYLYCVFKKCTDKKIRFDKLLVNDVNNSVSIIEEEGRKKGILREYQSRFKKTSSMVWGFPISGGDPKYEIIIPRGSIKNDFMLDLEQIKF